MCFGFGCLESRAEGLGFLRTQIRKEASLENARIPQVWGLRGSSLKQKNCWVEPQTKLECAKNKASDRVLACETPP